MFISTLIILIIDILSKFLIKHYLAFGNISIIKNILYLTYVENTGAAWSLFDENKYMVLFLSAIIIIGIIWYIFNEKPTRIFSKAAYSFILGGALGNFVNRLFCGYVIDFIDVKIFGYNYPIFNMADIFIVLGGMLLVYDTWRCSYGSKSAR